MKLVPEEEEKVGVWKATSFAKAGESYEIAEVYSTCVKKRKQLVSLPIHPPTEDVVPLGDGTHIEQENRDADDEHVILDEDFEHPQVVQPQ